MLKIADISTGYGKKQVLFDVSFTVNQGEIALLIGSNGSGKSTLLRTIYGLMRPFEGARGEIFFDNRDITKALPSELRERGLFYIPQKNSCFDTLTVKENLEISGLSLRSGSLYQERYKKVLKLYPILDNLLSQKPMKLSGGERHMLAFAMAFLHRPKMLLVDEPFCGLSLGTIETVREILANASKKEGVTVLMVEQRVKEGIEIADRVIGLKLGRVFSENVISDDFQLNDLDSVFV